MYDGLVVFNTATLNNDVTKLENGAKYFENKKSVFSRNASGGFSALGQLLEKISIIYADISSNLDEIKTFLNDYVNDIESLEKQMSNRGTGYIKCGVDIRKYKNLLSKLEMDDGNLFQINNYVGKSNKSTFNDPFLGLKTFGANVAVFGLSFVEGVGNVGEMVVDGGATVVAGACSIFGADNAANAVGDFIETDWSKRGYNTIVGSTGLDNYANPNSTAATVASVSGSVGGMIAVTVVTSGAAASAFGAGSASAVTVTSGVGAATGALTGAGSETERALQQGATIEEAEKVGAIGGAVGFATGFLGGKLDAAARGIGAKYGIQGVGKICGYSLASFGVNSSEPLINIMAHTAIYKNDSSSTFMENLAKNAADENLVISMGLTGGIGAAGTMIGGLSSIRTHNNSSVEPLDIGDSKVRVLTDTEIQTKMDQYNHLLDSSEDLRRIMANESMGYSVVVPDDIYDDYMLLKKLSGEITTGKTLDAVSGTHVTSSVNKSQVYSVADKKYSTKYARDYAREIDKNLHMSMETGLQLEQLFNSDDYILGLHLSGSKMGDAINADGLILTGHISTGGSMGDAGSLSQNINFFSNNTEVSFLNFLREIESASSYKTYDGIGDAVIVAIPKSDINISSRDISGFKFKDGINPISNLNSNTALDSRYILGYVRNDNGTLGTFNFNNKFGNNDFVSTLLNVPTPKVKGNNSAVIAGATILGSTLLTGQSKKITRNFQKEIDEKFKIDDVVKTHDKLTNISNINKSSSDVTIIDFKPFVELSEEECKNMRKEINDILVSNKELNDIFRLEAEGKEFVIPDDCLDDYNKIKRMRYELSIGKKEIKLPDWFNVNLTSNLDATLEYVSLSTLMSVINDEKSFTDFMNKNASEHLSIANAMKQLLAIIDANKYNFDLNDIQLSRARTIADNLASKDYSALSKIIDYYKTKNFDKLILNGDNPEKVLSTDFELLYQALQNQELLEYAGLTRNTEYVRIKDNIDAYYEEALDNIISRNVKLDDKEFNYLIRRLYDSRPINREISNYILSNYRDINDIDLQNQEIFKQIVAGAEAYKWADTKMLKLLDENLHDYFDGQIVSKINGSYQFEGDLYFKKGYKNDSSHIMGYNSTDGSHINLNYSTTDNLLESIVCHESLHHLSLDGQLKSLNEVDIDELKASGFDFNGVAKICSQGLKVNKHDINNHYFGDSFSGINEVATEYLNQQIMGDDYPTGHCGYEKAVPYLDILIKDGILDLEVLKDGYFNDGIGVVTNNIYQHVDVDASTISKLYSAFDDAISSDMEIREKGLMALNDIILDMKLAKR